LGLDALRRIGRTLCAACLVVAAATHARAADEPPTPRIEARSANLLLVGIVHGDRMSIHLSRLVDNAPVRDAVVSVSLRGILHPTTAQADGSYALQTKDLDLPGAAALEFDVSQGQSHEALTGQLTVADGAAKPEEKNSGRQLGWWVLNFAVCIGFLILLSRRRKLSRKESES
jgi:hypothetical protein